MHLSFIITIKLCFIIWIFLFYFSNFFLSKDCIYLSYFLILLLLFFTAGIGLIVYFLIYSARKPDRCSKCGELSQIRGLSSISEYNMNNNAYLEQEINSHLTNNYCDACGEKLDGQNARFCPQCGSETGTSIIICRD